MAKSTRDTLKQLSDGYAKNIDAAGLKVASMMVLYSEQQELTGNDYSTYIEYCTKVRDLTVVLSDIAAELRSMV